MSDDDRKESEQDPPDNGNRRRRNDGINASWGRMGLSIGGPNTITLLIILLTAAAFGSVIYINYTGFERQSSEHSDLVRAQEVNTCVDTLTVEEKAQMRTRWTTGYLHGLCPWMRDHRQSVSQ